MRPVQDLAWIRQRNRSGLNPYLDRLTEHPRTLLVEGVEAWRGRWTDRFGATRPLWVDLGCGSGNWLVRRAGIEPGWNHLGLELRFKRLVRSAQKTEKRGLTNLQFARHSAADPEEVLKPGEASAFSIQFPEPWLKPRQRKHRIFTPEGFRHLAALLPPGGQLLLKSDRHDYFNEMVGGARRAGFRLEAETYDLHGSEWAAANIETEFEQMFKREGRPIAWMTARRS